MTCVKATLKACREEIEKALDTVLPSQKTYPTVLHEAMRYSVCHAGKRIRPLFTLMAAETMGGTHADAMPAALAVELLHNYTLIHDDLPCMDDDDERRGRPTCHKKFGEANALLTGDALLTLAFETAAQSPNHPATIVQILARAGGSRGVVGGQVADLSANAKATSSELHYIHEHKTAILFAAATEMGGYAAGADAHQCELLKQVGHAVGMAFQIIDDLLDSQDPNDTSFSIVSIVGKKRARQQAHQWTEQALELLARFEVDTWRLQGLTDLLLERTC